MLKPKGRPKVLIFRLCVCCVIVVIGGQLALSKPLASRHFVLSKESEVGLEIEARSPGASWGKLGAEASALRIDVDGKYSQDLLLWAGDSPFIYKVMLGRLERGNHYVTAALNQSRSAVGAQQISIVSFRTIPFFGDSHHTPDDLLALQYYPVLYQRPDTVGRFSDLPVLMYYEVSHDREREIQIRYTIIFTNEDGGTPTAALMARWGRAADIEWVYQFRARDGKIVEESYQGIKHETKPFHGERTNGSHPLLAVASDNNNFSDQPGANARVALLPIAADLREFPRERVMDMNPWIYRLVAEELLREGKLKPEPTGSDMISDPRNYVYVDLRAMQNETAISIEASTIQQPNSSSSDLGEAKLRIDRSGYFRTAIRLPSRESTALVSTLTVHCYSVKNDCKDVEVRSVAVLSDAYEPRLLPIESVPPQDLKPNQTMTIKIR